MSHSQQAVRGTAWVRRATILAAGLALLLPGRLHAQGLEYVKEHYTKYEYRIPMRDGKRLFTAVYAPKDYVAAVPDPPVPHAVQRAALRRRPVQAGPRPLAAVRQAGLHLRLPGRARPVDVGRRVRQRAAVPAGRRTARATSTRAATPATPSTGSSSTCPTTTARSGMWGISYPGFYASTGMIDAHPALKAASPQAPIADWFIGDDWHHNGALMLPHVFNFMAVFGRPRPQPIKKSTLRVRPRDARRLPVLPRHGPAGQRQRPATSRTTWRSGTR